MLKESAQRLSFFFRAITHRKLDALDLLEKDHIRVEMLFFRWRFSSERAHREHLFEMIKREITLHTQLEETVFYPACLKIPELRDFIHESVEEHQQVKRILEEISELSIVNEKALAKMKVLMDDLELHVTQEENELFPKVRALIKIELAEVEPGNETYSRTERKEGP